nr:MAG: hypothetical protein [Microviridae sp.]
MLKNRVVAERLSSPLVMGVYTIQDSDLDGQCGPLYEALNDIVARKAARQMLLGYPNLDVTSMSLIRIGTYDRQSGLLSPFDECHTVTSGSDLLCDLSVKPIIKE